VPSAGGMITVMQHYIKACFILYCRGNTASSW
jgi:hypothetical protein